MNLLEKIQEQYIQDFSDNIPFDEFLLNVLITAILANLLRLFYIRYGDALSNRRRFGANFMPLALGTLLIIMIVKSSIALSLGLVGALSIVRFRAAIKDPEELTYLFFAIGIGLAGGANQPILAVVAFILIVGLLFVSKLNNPKQAFRSEDRLFLNITTDQSDLKQITQILSNTLPYVELKRLDTLEQGLDLSFVCKAVSIEQLDTVCKELQKLSKATRLSIIDQPDLII